MSKRDEYRQVLRKGMAYCWSVAVAACPEAGKPIMERWLLSTDREVRWVMRQNLAKQRLARADANWVTTWLAQLAAWQRIVHGESGAFWLLPGFHHLSTFGYNALHEALMIDCIVVVSGGMDSVTLLYYLVKRKRRLPALLTFRYGQKHGQEIKFARYHAQRLGCRDHRVLDLSLLAPAFSGSSLVSSHVAIPDAESVLDDPQPSTYVPNRNMVFLSIAVAYAETRGVNEVYYGAQRHDQPGYWDASQDFVDQMNAVLSLNRKNAIRIYAPFAFNSKADIVRLGFELGVDFGKTWSCFRGGEKACGLCSACVERLRAFDEMGLRDTLPYQTINRE